MYIHEKQLLNNKLIHKAGEILILNDATTDNKVVMDFVERLHQLCR